MSNRIIHCCLSVAGGIRNAESLKGCITVDGKTLVEVKEIKAFLQKHLDMGHRVLPVGDCDNFDYQTGCLGHIAEGKEEQPQ